MRNPYKTAMMKSIEDLSIYRSKMFEQSFMAPNDLESNRQLGLSMGCTFAINLIKLNLPRQPKIKKK